MKKGNVTIVMDGGAGSSGKGKVAGHIALAHNGPFVAINNFMSNAGHTVVLDDGTQVMTQHLPSSIVHKNAVLCIGPGAAITPEILVDEINRFNEMGLLNNRKIMVHPRAMVIKEGHRVAEMEMVRSGSTFKGCGMAQAQKIIRDPNVELFGGFMKRMANVIKHLDGVVDKATFDMASTLTQNVVLHETQYTVNQAINDGMDVLIEGSQGFDLDINYGLGYPHVTSRQCNAGQLVADCGIAPTLVTDVVMVMRPYPIRISNQTNIGIEVSSGDYGGSPEITWEIVKERCGAPVDVQFGETTTVTKKLRRVFELNEKRLYDATLINRPTQIALNFAQYIDYDIIKCKSWEDLTPKIKGFILKVEDITGVPVTMVGTGAKNSEMIIRPKY